MDRVPSARLRVPTQVAPIRRRDALPATSATAAGVTAAGFADLFERLRSPVWTSPPIVAPPLGSLFG